MPLALTTGGNYIKVGLPGKSILGDYFQENRTSQRPFLLLRISFPGRPIFIQSIPGKVGASVAVVGTAHHGRVPARHGRVNEWVGAAAADALGDHLVPLMKGLPEVAGSQQVTVSDHRDVHLSAWKEI